MDKNPNTRKFRGLKNLNNALLIFSYHIIFITIINNIIAAAASVVAANVCWIHRRIYAEEPEEEHVSHSTL